MALFDSATHWLAKGNQESIESLFARHGDRYRLLAIAAVGAGTIAVMLLSTIVNVAIPQIMTAFQITQSEAQWLATGYLASATVSMLMSGWCLRRFGTRDTFIMSSLVVLASSAVCGASPNAGVLISARIVQGLAYGFFLPVAMYVMTRVFPAERQGFAMGIFGILAVFGPAVGPYFGGIAVDHLGWRWVFFLPLPLSLVSLPLALLYLPGPDKNETVGRLDWIGLIWLSLAVSLLLLMFNSGSRLGWQHWSTLTCLTGSAITALMFYRRQRHTDSPLMDLELFQNRNFCVAGAITFLYGGALFGGMYLIPLFLQTAMGMSPIDAGLALLPAGIILGLAFPICGNLSDRLPPHWMILSGMLMLGISFYIMKWADSTTALVTICWWLVLGRIGMAVAMPALSMSAFTTLPQQQLTHGSATINFTRQIGGAFGVNLTSVFLDYRLDLHTSAAAAQPLTEAFHDTFIASGVLILATMLPSLLLKPRKRARKAVQE